LLCVDTLLDCARMDHLVSTNVVVSKWRMDGWIWWLWEKNEGWTDSVLWLVVAKFESTDLNTLKIQIEPLFPWDEKGENRPSEESGWVLAIWRLIAKCKRNGWRTGNPWQIIGMDGQSVIQFLLFANAFLAVVPFSSLSPHLICSSPTLSFISPAIFCIRFPRFYLSRFSYFWIFFFFKS